MAEMNAVGRFFVNAFSARRSRRRYAWIRAQLTLPPGSTILEVGCGNADLAARMTDGFAPVRCVAVDLEPRQIEAARQNLARRYPAGAPAALELRAADMLGLPFPPAQFDAVLAFEALHHAGPDHHDFERIAGALAEIDRVLRPGGVLVYEDFVRTDRLQSWLAGHGYAIGPVLRRRRHESAIARKPRDPAPAP